MTWNSEVPAHEQAPTNASLLARDKRDEDVRRRRDAQAACAWAFRSTVHPDHDAKCVYAGDHDSGGVCSRMYDPGPITPEEEAFYEGTPIGALFGLDGSERFAHELAGWTIRFQGDDVTPFYGPEVTT